MFSQLIILQFSFFFQKGRNYDIVRTGRLELLNHQLKLRERSHHEIVAFIFSVPRISELLRRKKTFNLLQYFLDSYVFDILHFYYSGIVPINNVESYTENKLKYIKRGGKQIGFKLAVEECDQFLANNSVCQ